jgi:hypothetical protein
MRTCRSLASVTVVFLGALATDVLADEWYVAAKLGPMIVDSAAVDDPINAGVQLGYKWTHTIGELGLEAEYTNSINRGQADGADLSIETATVYGAFRTAGPVYLKARLGATSNTIELGDESEHGIATAVGGGIGFHVWYLQIEFAYTRISQDLDFVAVSLQF